MRVQGSMSSKPSFIGSHLQYVLVTHVAREDSEYSELKMALNLARAVGVQGDDRKRFHSTTPARPTVSAERTAAQLHNQRPSVKSLDVLVSNARHCPRTNSQTESSKLRRLYKLNVNLSSASLIIISSRTGQCSLEKPRKTAGANDGS
jgi:NAD(P)-dependent dehydrogenase (short-subunit alcohol dehydrogenase family)